MTETIQIIEIVKKDIQKVIITAFHICKNRKEKVGMLEEVKKISDMLEIKLHYVRLTADQKLQQNTSGEKTK